MPQIGPLGVIEIIIILVVILIIFGPKNLPKLGSAVGKAVKNLREGLGGKKQISEKEEATQQTAETAEATPQKAEAAEEAPELEVIDKPEPGQKRTQEEGEKTE